MQCSDAGFAIRIFEEAGSVLTGEQPTGAVARHKVIADMINENFFRNMKTPHCKISG
jgi:hypothetical protein